MKCHECDEYIEGNKRYKDTQNREYCDYICRNRYIEMENKSLHWQSKELLTLKEENTQLKNELYWSKKNHEIKNEQIKNLLGS